MDAANNAGPKSQASSSITVASAASTGTQPVPGHTRIAYDVPRTNTPLVTTGEITDLEYIGNRVFVAGTFSSVQNNAAGNTTTYNQPSLFSFNIDTGLVDANFRPTFGGGGVQEVEASPDGTKLFVVGTLQHRQRRHQAQDRLDQPDHRRDGARASPPTRTARRPPSRRRTPRSTSAASSRRSTALPAARLAAVSATTGSGRHRASSTTSPGGIGVNGDAVRAGPRAHPRRQQAARRAHRPPDRRPGPVRHGADRHRRPTSCCRGAPSSGTTTSSSSAASRGSIAGAIAPDDQYFVVSSGSGGDRPPISDTVVAYPDRGRRQRPAAVDLADVRQRLLGRRSARSPSTSAATSTTTSHRPRRTRGRGWTTSATAVVRAWPATASATTS